MTTRTAAAGPAGSRPVPTRARRQARHLAQSIVLEESGPSALLRAALLLVCALVFVFIGWAGFTTVKEVAKATGTVVPSRSLQIIQHKEGGIVREVLVEKGQTVEVGQVLARLDPVEAQSDLEAQLTHFVSLQLKAERLRAFAENRPPDFTFADERYRPLVEDQRRVLDGQRAEHEAARQVLQDQLDSTLKENTLLENKISSLERQLVLVGQQRDMRRELMVEGLGSRLTFLEVEREIERLHGEITELTNQRELNVQRRRELTSRLTQLEATKRRDALDEMGEVNAEISEVDQRIMAEADRLDRLAVTAPTRGLIQDVRVRTPGAVLQPGDALLTLVPIDDVLIVESRIETRDVGHVQVGQPVTVRVTAYDFARYGSVEGVLADVSPTTFFDEQTGQPYYRGFVELSQNYVGDRPDVNPILPGMTVDASIITGEKTILAYLLRPIYISLAQAFQER
ncbi:HlyD family type I secretion periplasmic adaptor subunit [Roseospira marina]|uniref:Membrane fusion protein (MFP) family protein n=1 Tax=Roseospira marina TaxID=140057 RepID=A0A5M6IAZ1_9PROT|nr:HlyD family type I secretion periplasmic adaptor subunit [Roseospira marina]KAA5605127.1 HlyD family type I secretion periplasmic adaptor subunit [Roseospira marina]MBB4314879.1 HlyD family type I secretion membrane fusion protein [Roseospira marina]MBB5087879.1 HlyD family type I secretion membrane fusion protein [Roseospira marina]